MVETRKLAAILAADIVGYSRLTSVDEDRTLARVRALRTELIDPVIAANRGRVVKRTGDGAIVEFRSVVDAVNCARETQNGMIERNSGLPDDQKIVYRIGIHVGDVVEEEDGDLMGDGVNIAARLEGIAKPGAICLSEAAYWQVKTRLDLKVSDLGPTALKNIAEPVRVYSLEVGAPAQAKPASQSKPPEPKKRSMLALLVAGIVALILIAGGLWYFLAGNRPARAAHLSIVVLPFANLSNDPSQDYFADGVTENLTTDLSRIRNSFVIARNTAFTYKGKSVDAKQIGKDLGVRYVLEGSVQRDQNRVRVNAQLIDAETGAHLWAERFEEDIVDLFKLQDQVVTRLANSMGDELARAEAEKGAHSNNPDAIDLTLRAQALRSQPFQRMTKDNINSERALYEQALKIDPNDADALAGDAWTYTQEYAYGWGRPETDYEAKVLSQADRSIALAPDNIWAYFAKSVYLSVTHRADEALSAANAGLAINPNSAVLYGGARGLAEVYLGRFEQAKSDELQAMRLSPRDSLLGAWHNFLGRAELGLGHFDAAIDECRQAIDAGYRIYAAYETLAAAYALGGKMDEAKSALAEARRLNPKLTIKWLIAHSGTPVLFDGLRKAGLPEE